MEDGGWRMEDGDAEARRIPTASGEGGRRRGGTSLGMPVLNCGGTVEANPNAFRGSPNVPCTTGK